MKTPTHHGLPAADRHLENLYTLVYAQKTEAQRARIAQAALNAALAAATPIKPKEKP